MDYTRKMLNEIRKHKYENKKIDLPEEKNIVENDNLYNRFKVLMTEAEKKNLNYGMDSIQPNDKPYVINSTNRMFGDVLSSQKDAIRKTIGDVSFKEDALKYYPDIHDIVINGEVVGIGVTFQFRYKDRSGDGCYIWNDGLQLTDANLRTVEKIRDAFINWKQSLTDDGDLIDKIDKEANKE